MAHLKTSKAAGTRASLRLGFKKPLGDFQTTSHTCEFVASGTLDIGKRKSWFSGNKVWDKDELLPDIYIGSLADALCFQDLADLGIFRCFNCGGPECIYDTHRGEELGIKYVYYPIPDSEDYPIAFDMFKCALDFVKDAKTADSAVFVHCFQGISRSATIVIGMLMHLYDMTFDVADSKVRESRPKISPNLGFIVGLDALFVHNTRGHFCHENDPICCDFHEQNRQPRKIVRIGNPFGANSMGFSNPFEMQPG